MFSGNWMANITGFNYKGVSCRYSTVSRSATTVKVLTGAYELPKEHETEFEFHDNPNYVTVFVLCHAQMALQPCEVETSLPPSKKIKTLRKTQPTLPLPCVTLVMRNFVYSFK